MSGWLTYILSEEDRRLNQAAAWVRRRQHVLRLLLSSELQAGDFRNECLAIGLGLLRDDDNWAAFEAGH